MQRMILIEENELHSKLKAIFFDCFLTVFEDHLPKEKPKEKPKEDRYITTEEAADIAGVSKSTIRRWAANGYFKRFHFGGSVRYYLPEFKNYLTKE